MPNAVKNDVHRNSKLCGLLITEEFEHTNQTLTIRLSVGMGWIVGLVFETVVVSGELIGNLERGCTQKVRPFLQSVNRAPTGSEGNGCMALDTSVDTEKPTKIKSSVRDIGIMD